MAWAPRGRCWSTSSATPHSALPHSPITTSSRTPCGRPGFTPAPAPPPSTPRRVGGAHRRTGPLRACARPAGTPGVRARGRVMQGVRRQLPRARDHAGELPQVRAARREIDPVQEFRRSTAKQDRCLGVDVGDKERGKKESCAARMLLERGKQRLLFLGKMRKAELFDLRNGEANPVLLVLLAIRRDNLLSAQGEARRTYRDNLLLTDRRIETNNPRELLEHQLIVLRRRRRTTVACVG